MNKEEKKEFVIGFLKTCYTFFSLLLLVIMAICLYGNENEIADLKNNSENLAKQLDKANDTIIDRNYDLQELRLANDLLNGDDVYIKMDGFLTTGYCKCPECCGKWSNSPTKSGTTPKEGRTVAVDPTVIPLGSEIIMDDHVYIAEDTGSAIKGKRIDVYYENHEDAENHSLQRRNIFVKIK